jgi:two-component system response regulator RegX3
MTVKDEAKFFAKSLHTVFPDLPYNGRNVSGGEMGLSKNRKASVLVVEDDPAMLKGLLDVLIFNGYEASGVEDGRKGLEKALEENHDLLLLDVMLPGVDGFTICREVRRNRPGQGILMLTAKGAEDDVVAGFQAGADDYVTKPFSLRELMVRVEAVLRRMGKVPLEDPLEFRGIRIDGKTLTASCRGQETALTRKEMDIIVYLHRHLGRVVPRKELLREVWNYTNTDVETRTVEIHILKLRKKIGGLIGDEPFITTVRGEGYRMEPEP